jgi:Caspase domain
MRFIIRLFAAACCAIAALSAGPASAEKRVALVIGNADYKIGPLANPVNDATAVAEAFEKTLGFDKVILRKNLTFEGFRVALMDLAREVAGAELGVVYFAGHGTEVAGKNFLIPVDARLAKSGDLSLEAIALDSVLEQLAGASRLKLVILDACRNNLFPVAGAKRAVSRGLSRIEPEDNTLVVYAAKDGTTADDGMGQQHSPFTQALLKHIATPGLEVNFVFRRVRDDVVAATNPVQTPHVYGTLGGRELYLKPGAAGDARPVAATPAPLTQADRMWAVVKDTTDIPALEAFRRHYGKENPVYDRLAQARIEQLKKQQVSAVTPPPPPPPKAVAPAPPKGAEPYAYDLFPVNGMVLGKSTTKELAVLGTHNARVGYYAIGGINFWYSDNIFSRFYLVTRLYPLPAEWSRLGLSYEASYREWLSILKKMEYNIKVSKEPTVEDYGGQPSFSAELEARSTRGTPLVMTLNFEYSQKVGIDTKGTLYSITVAVPAGK